MEQQHWCCTAQHRALVVHQLDSACADAILSQGIPSSGLCVCGQQVSWFFNKCENLALAEVLCRGLCYFMYLGQAYSFFSCIFQGAEGAALPQHPAVPHCHLLPGQFIGTKPSMEHSSPNKDSQWEFLPAHVSSNLEPKAGAIQQGLSTSMDPWQAGLPWAALSQREDATEEPTGLGSPPRSLPT